jgi:hypothetical protein
MPPVIGEAAPCDIDLMRWFHVVFMLGTPQRAVSCGTAVEFEPWTVPPEAVVVVRQITCPKSRFAELGER